MWANTNIETKANKFTKSYLSLALAKKARVRTTQQNKRVRSNWNGAPSREKLDRLNEKADRCQENPANGTHPVDT